MRAWEWAMREGDEVKGSDDGGKGRDDKGKGSDDELLVEEMKLRQDGKGWQKRREMTGR